MSTNDGREPALDLFRRGASYHAVLDLPGVSNEHLRVRLRGRRVTVEAERQYAREHADDVLVAERGTGGFQRAFDLPDDADPSTLTADCTDGTLHLAAAVADPDHQVSDGDRDIDVAAGGGQLASADQGHQQDPRGGPGSA